MAKTEEKIRPHPNKSYMKFPKRSETKAKLHLLKAIIPQS